MKTSLYKTITLFSIIFLCQGCFFFIGSPAPEPEPQYRPVYMSRNDLDQSVGFQATRSLSKPGKIYTYGQYILVNERYKGIHVIDNQNPSNPVNIGFINIPGNIDMAIRNNVLYADNAVDLVTMNIGNWENIQVFHRRKDAFPTLEPPDRMWDHYDASKGIVVEWIKK